MMESVQTVRRINPVCMCSSSPLGCSPTEVTGFAAFHCAHTGVAAKNADKQKAVRTNQMRVIVNRSLLAYISCLTVWRVESQLIQFLPNATRSGAGAPSPAPDAPSGYRDAGKAVAVGRKAFSSASVN